MKYLALILTLLLIASLTACTRGTPAKQTDTKPTGTETPINQPIEPALLDKKIDPNVAKIFDKTGTVKSYQFDIYDFSTKKSEGTFYVRGDKAKIKLLLPAVVERNAPDYVYLDLKEKKARAYCLNENRCEPVMGWDVDYDKYIVTLPPEWIDGFKYGTLMKSQTFYNRPVQVVQYESDGKWYEAYIDNYFGYPVRVAIATDKEMTNIIGGYEYRSVAFNSISDSDVTAPTV